MHVPVRGALVLISDIWDLSRDIFFNKLKYFITDFQIGIH